MLKVLQDHHEECCAVLSEGSETRPILSEKSPSSLRPSGSFASFEKIAYLRPSGDGGTRERVLSETSTYLMLLMVIQDHHDE